VANVPDSVRVDVRAMVKWINARAHILDRIEYARHKDGAWLGQIYIITPEVEGTTGK
jgi:hypothetical protein